MAITMCYKIGGIIYIISEVNLQCSISNVIAMLLLLPHLSTIKQESVNHYRKKKISFEKWRNIAKCIILCMLTVACHTF